MLRRGCSELSPGRTVVSGCQIADLKKIVSEGTGKMKGIKDIDAKGADDLVAFLRTLAKK